MPTILPRKNMCTVWEKSPDKIFELISYEVMNFIDAINV